MSDTFVKKYMVQSDRECSEEFASYSDAEELFEEWKDFWMAEGVNEDSYLEIVESEDDFEDSKIIKKVVAVVDNDREESKTPREEGIDWDYWAKWQEVDE